MILHAGCHTHLAVLYPCCNRVSQGCELSASKYVIFLRGNLGITVGETLVKMTYSGSETIDGKTRNAPVIEIELIYRHRQTSGLLLIGKLD